MDKLEAARLRDGLNGAFEALQLALVGRTATAQEWFGDHPGLVTTPDEFLPSPVPEDLEISENLADAREVAEAVFGAGPLSGLYVPAVVAIPGVRIYAGRFGNDPVTTAIGWTAARATGIFQVATLPAHRGRGYGGAVTGRAVVDGFAAGADLAWLQTGGMGENLYRSLGFRSSSDRTFPHLTSSTGDPTGLRSSAAP
jgi:GNAT superfamily N-acetyltransferase